MHDACIIHELLLKH